MNPEYDQTTRDLVDRLKPRWLEIRAAARRFSNDKVTNFVTEALLFIGHPSLLCCMTTKEFRGGLWEYFPIYLEEVDETKYAPEEWITLARKGGKEELDRKLQWLFETPSLSLTEGIESFTDWPPKADSKETSFCFYNGLEVKDSQGRGSLRIIASDQPDFTVTLSFSI
jgi:hypothetical protein